MSPAEKRLQKIHFVALGCPKNRVDTEVMAGLARQRGMEIVPLPQDADVIVVNTCAFIESARAESVDVLLEMAKEKKDGKCRTLIAAGCLAQRFGTELGAEMPEVDFVIGTAHPDHLGKALDGRLSRIDVGPPAHFLQGAKTPRFIERGAVSAYLKIADGCSRKCSFCAIPGIRGTARSRPIAEIAAEAKRLAKAGVRELCLVSQDTSAFGRDLGRGDMLPELLGALDRIDGIAWIRLLYLYPDAVTDKLLQAMRDLEKVVPYLDVPIQHASSSMLKRMRRGHGQEKLERLVLRARKHLPGAFLRTAVLVGHPGEADADFEALMEFLEKARFDHLGAFCYSEEQETAAADQIPKVARGVARRRYRKVMALGRRLSKQRCRELKGQELDVLIEGPADDSGYVLTGRHVGQAPEVDGLTYIVSCDLPPGSIVRGRVVRTSDHDLVVEPV